MSQPKCIRRFIATLPVLIIFILFLIPRIGSAAAISAQASSYDLYVAKLVRRLESDEFTKKDRRDIQRDLLEMGKSVLTEMTELYLRTLKNFPIFEQNIKALGDKELSDPAKKQAFDNYFRNGDNLEFCIEILGQIGNEKTLALLQQFPVKRFTSEKQYIFKEPLYYALQRLKSRIEDKAKGRKTTPEEIELLMRELTSNPKANWERADISERLIQIGDPSVKAIDGLIDGLTSEQVQFSDRLRDGIKPGSSIEAERSDKIIFEDCAFVLGEIGGQHALQVLYKLKERRSWIKATDVAIAKIKNKAEIKQNQKPKKRLLLSENKWWFI
jgi:hypothetical protein